MSNTVVVDDSRLSIGTGTAVPQVVYSPPESWRSKAACDACDLGNDAALNLLQATAKDGTWTNAWWEASRPSLSASINFQGTDVAVYFILFIRRLDPRSTGPANLTFYVDDTMRNVRPLRPEDYPFNSNNFTPRMQLFQVSGLNPDVMHSLRVQWTHNGVTRPAVAVALDSIEFTPSGSALDGNTVTTAISTSSTSTGRPQTDSTEASESRQANDTTRIVVGVLVPVVVLLALAVVVLMWGRRRRRRVKVETTQPPDRRGLGQSYHIEPFSPTSNAGGDLPSMVQTENTSAASPVASGAQPPSYLESLSLADDTSGSSGPSRFRSFMPIVKSHR